MNRYLGITLGTIFAGLLAVGSALGQTASLLPNAVQSFTDNNGKPLANGNVYFYVPSTTTPKTVWSDSAETTPQAQPVALGTAGRPASPIFGDGSYRQVVQDQFGNTIWDYVTTSTGSGGGGGGGGGGSGDGLAVGTVLLWSGTTLPTNYLYTAGQTVSRTTYSALLTAITYSTTALCQSGIASVTVPTTMSDGTPIGAAIEASCFAPGTTVLAKVSGQLTMSTNATTTTSTTLQVFPYGNGDGATTFALPDYRGRVPAGRDNMNSSIAGVLTSTYYGVNPDALGAVGGAQSQTLTLLQLPGGITTANASQSISVGSPSGDLIAALPSTGAVGSVPVPSTGTLQAPYNSALNGGWHADTTGFAGSNSITTTSSNTGALGTGAGAAAPHPNVQPSLTSDYIIKAIGDGGGGGTGTVTTVSIVSANGFAGSVANATTTPAITLTTSITGLVKGNGTALSAATSCTDYQPAIALTTTGSSGAATFNCSTGALNIPQYSGGGGSGTVSSGTTNQLGYYASSGTTISGLATATNGVLITSGSGAPSISSTLPSAVQGNITSVGTVASGTWNGSTVSPTYGGTGVNNGSSTLTLGGNTAFSGAYPFTGTLTGSTGVTFPTSGTLATTSNTVSSVTCGTGLSGGTITSTGTCAVLYGSSAGNSLQGNGTTLPSTYLASALTSVGTIATGTWQGSTVGVGYGGTGGTTFTANAPLIGNGGSAIAQGTRSGNTTKFATANGTLTNGDCVSLDSSGNFVDAGGPCTTGGGGGTVASGTANQIGYYASSGTTISGSSTLPSAVQANITGLGTITSGTWQGAAIAGYYGGTGVNNGPSTIAYQGNVAFSGAYTFGATLTNNTAVTFPTSGTLATVSNINTALPSITATKLYGGTATAGLAQAVSVGAGLSLSGGTLSSTSLPYGNIINAVQETTYCNTNTNPVDSSGTFDSTTGINNCITHYGAVSLPAGTYLISGASGILVANAMTLVGAGMGQTIIKQTTASGCIFSINGGANSTFEGFTLDRTVQATSGGNGFCSGSYPINNFTWRDLVIQNQYYGMYLPAAYLATIDNVNSNYNYSDGFRFDNQTTSVALQYNIINAVSQQNAGYGFTFVASSGGYVPLNVMTNIVTFANCSGGMNFYGTGTNTINDVRVVNYNGSGSGATDINFQTYGEHNYIGYGLIEGAGAGYGAVSGPGICGRMVNPTASGSWTTSSTTISIPSGLLGITAGQRVFDGTTSKNIGIVSTYSGTTLTLTTTAAFASSGSTDALIIATIASGVGYGVLIATNNGEVSVDHMQIRAAYNSGIATTGTVSSLSLSNNSISDSNCKVSATYGVGCIANTGGDSGIYLSGTIANAAITGNTGEGAGTQVYGFYNGATVTNSSITGNTFLGTTAGCGGTVINPSIGNAGTGCIQTSGPVLLNTLTASSSATLSDLTSLTAGYTDYELVFENVTPATNSNQCELQIYSNGSYQTSNYLAEMGYFSAGAYSIQGETTYFMCSATAVSNGQPGISGTIKIYNPSSAQGKHMNGLVQYYNGSALVAGNTTGFWNGTTTMTGFKVFFSSGNIASGSIRVYGIY